MITVEVKINYSEDEEMIEAHLLADGIKEYNKGYDTKVKIINPGGEEEKQDNEDEDKKDEIIEHGASCPSCGNFTWKVQHEVVPCEGLGKTLKLEGFRAVCYTTCYVCKSCGEELTEQNYNALLEEGRI